MKIEYDVRNINTAAHETLTTFNEFLELADRLEMNFCGEYRKGFRDGVKALGIVYLKNHSKKDSAKVEE